MRLSTTLLLACLTLVAVLRAQDVHAGDQFRISEPEKREIERKANQGDPQAMYQFAQLQPFESCKEWWRRAANLGYAPAQMQIAMLEEPNQLNRAKSREEKKLANQQFRNRLTPIFKALQDGATGGDLEAIFMLGASDSYFSKWGIAKEMECFFWLRKAGELGHPKAPLALACEFLESRKFNAAPQDAVEGFSWLRKATETGEFSSRVTAIIMLTRFYSYGSKAFAFKRDPKEAMKWANRGATLEGISLEDFFMTNGLQHPYQIKKEHVQFD